VNGNVTVTGEITAFYSDERLKTRTGHITNVLDKLAALETFYFKYNSKAKELGFSREEERLGISAQALLGTFPNIVRQNANGYLTYSTDQLVVALLQGINELQEQVQGLKNDIAILRGA
jgi:hypothetical protein